MASSCSPGSLREAAWRSIPGSWISTTGKKAGGSGRRQTGWAAGRSSWTDKQGAFGKCYGVIQWLLDHCKMKLRGNLDKYLDWYSEK